MVASMLKIVITQNTICENLVGFPKLGHVLGFIVTISVYLLYFKYLHFKYIWNILLIYL